MTSSMSHAVLLRHCVHVLDTFDPEMHAVEEHIVQYLNEHQITDEVDRTFITEVFSGCVRYGAIMRVLTDGFYTKDGKNVLRSEQNLYVVLAYLTLFRLEELGMEHFKQFVVSQDLNRMSRFFSFFFDERNLMTWIKDQWNLIYDTSFVQETLLDPLSKFLPELRELVKYLKAKVENKVKAKRQVAPTTEVKAFQLTQPQPRSIPMPEPEEVSFILSRSTSMTSSQIPKVAKPKPAPAFKNPPERQKIAATRDQNRRRAEERLMEASRLQFACANPEKSYRTKEVMEEIVAEQNQQLDFNRRHSRAIPDFSTKPVAIKTNTATILREGQLYQKREEEEIKKLEQLEAGAKDSSDFLHWQTEMRRKDLEAELAAVEQRRLSGRISYEEAILARSNLMKENRQKVQEMKEQAQKAMQEYMNKRFQEELDIKRLVEETLQGHKNARIAQAKLQERKGRLVQAMHEESKELMALAFEQAEEDMRKKLQLINQIRAMEAVPVIRQKLVDPTEIAGHGLLSEMSIAELNERLALLKTAEIEAQETKRDEINANKEAKSSRLMNTLECIYKHRNEQGRLAANKLEDRKRGVESARMIEIRTDELTDLENKLAQRRAERQRLQESRAAQSAQVRSKSHTSQKRVLEENRWKELERSRERTARLASRRPTQRLTEEDRLRTTRVITTAI